jgi:hypothetical protein
MELYDCEMSIDICSETCNDLRPAYISLVNHKPALIWLIIRTIRFCILEWATKLLFNDLQITSRDHKISHYLPLTCQRHERNLYVWKGWDRVRGLDNARLISGHSLLTPTVTNNMQPCTHAHPQILGGYIHCLLKGLVISQFWIQKAVMERA